MSSNGKTEMSPEQLLKSDRPEDFAQVYDMFGSALFGIVCRIVMDEEQASDVLQDAFIKVWEKRKTYDASKGTVFTWILNITRNTAIDYKRSKHARYSGKIQNITNNVSIINQKSSEQTNTETMGMNEAIETLSPEQKKIIDMMYFTGLSQEEVSNELKIPLGTVKTRARSAIGKLRSFYNFGLKK